MDASAHRRRMEHIAWARQSIRTSTRHHVISDYLAGQVTYNLGEYPARFSIAPTQYDADLLGVFADHGATLIQLHEEWNDSQRCLGADKFTSHDPEGLRQFIDLAHSLGMKVILYGSTGFFESTDPDFQEDWAHPSSHLVELYFDYARCSPASPEWRAYVLPRLERLLTDIGADGIYDDLGYIPLHRLQPMAGSHVAVGPEDEEHNSALDDLLGMLMGIVRRHGGILKVHHGGTSILAKDLYDYLWVGEGVDSLDQLRLKCGYANPYVVPCPDMSRATVEAEDDLYLHSVPSMQFPLRVDGRPCTGERAAVPGMTYRHGEQCFWTRHMRSVWRHCQRHPDAPPMYGWWDSFPGRVEGRERWLHHLDLYLPMVQAGSHVWLGVRESDMFREPIPEDVTVSLFVNDRVYLVAANFGTTEVTLESDVSWIDREDSAASRSLPLCPRSMRYLMASDSRTQRASS